MITDILNIGSTIIDKLFPDKAEKEKMKLELLRLQQDGELKEVEQRMSVMLAEAKSKDPWTSRARPSFMYVIYIMILFAIPMGILSAFNPEIATQVAEGMKSWLSSIPDGLWATFGIGYSGYAISRSYDKKTISKQQAAAGG